MKHELSTIEADILTGCVSELDRVLALGVPQGYGYSAAKQAWRDALQGLVRCAPGRWTEADTSNPSERVKISRAYRSLEKRGLVECVAQTGTVVTHLRPTEAGKAYLPNCGGGSVPPLSESEQPPAGGGSNA